MKRAFGLLLLVALPACQGLVDGAKEQFSKDHTCPLDRIEARARPDLHPSSFRQRRNPPADIAADPGRLQLWQKTQEESRTSADRMFDIAEARGCDRHTFYQCSRSSKHADRMNCSSETDVPAALSSW